ncbi:MAG TPA: hypothetical protein VKE51_12440 [Vicinamibacterales bacterium]|nr:hypothetical protein [Vicinamibacterales bacterium]
MCRRQLAENSVFRGVGFTDLSLQDRLFRDDGLGVVDDYSYAVSLDGQRFLVNTIASDASQAIVVVSNWPAALKK